jgi:HlyD family type I secretion membrane fusion protein
MWWKRAKPVGADANPELPAEEQPRAEAAIGTAIIGVFVVGALGFAALVPLDAGAYAEGVVAVSGNRQAVQHRDGGIVSGIAVSEGQSVKKGQVLLTVSSSELIAAERSAAGETIFLLAMRERLRAELSGADRVGLPAEFATLAKADQDLANDAMLGQRQLFNTRRESLAAEQSVLRQRMVQHAEQISGYNHQMVSNREQLRLIKEEIGGLRELLPRGFVAVNRLRAVERTSAELDGNYGAYQSEAARSAAARGEARMQMVALSRQMITDSAAQLREVQVRLDELQPKLHSLREQLSRSIIRAPASGRVVGLSVFTEGGVVAAGATLMEIVPQDRQLIIEGKVSPGDADDVRPGMQTQVRFSGLHERNLPILHGNVTKVSADSMENDRTGERYFRIEVVVQPDQLKLVRDIRPYDALQAGLPAEILVPLRKRTALQYLVEPLSQSLWRAGREH